MNPLVQKIKRDKRVFLITENGVSVDIETAKERQHYDVPFNSIHKDIVRLQKTADTIVIMLIFSLLMNVILCVSSLENLFNINYDTGKIVLTILMVLLFGALFLFKDHLKKTDVKTIVAEKSLQFLYTPKYRADVDTFISEIFAAQQKYFVKKYFKIDEILSYESNKNNIIWLYQNQMITDSDARFILNELETLRIIGKVKEEPQK